MRKVNLIPMAGAGKRFVDAGYRVPKPLIPVAGIPMVIRAAAALPPCDHWVFVCQEEHLKNSEIGNVLRAKFGDVDIVPVSGMTEGQACTCMLAEPSLRPDDMLTIGACDNAMTWDRARWVAFEDDRSVDALIWTFRRNSAVLQNPRMYGWVAVDPRAPSRATRVSCKVPLSPTPMEDHAVIGAFTFRRASDFARCVRKLIADNRRVNNEFYMDEALGVGIELGLRVEVMEVERYICWGTPQDLDIFNYWRTYFLHAGLE